LLSVDEGHRHREFCQSSPDGRSRESKWVQQVPGEGWGEVETVGRAQRTVRSAADDRARRKTSRPLSIGCRRRVSASAGADAVQRTRSARTWSPRTVGAGERPGPTLPDLLSHLRACSPLPRSAVICQRYSPTASASSRGRAAPTLLVPYPKVNFRPKGPKKRKIPPGVAPASTNVRDALIKAERRDQGAAFRRRLT